MIGWIISSSVLIAVIIGLRFALRDRVSQRIIYALWALVLIRLLVPVGFGSTGFSVASLAQNLVSGTAAVSENTVTYNESSIAASDYGASQGAHVTDAGIGSGSEPDSQHFAGSQPEDRVSGISNSYYEQDEERQTAPATSGAGIFSDPVNVIFVLWSAGSVTVLAWFIICNTRFGRNLKKSRLPVETGTLEKAMHGVDSKLNTHLPVYMSDQIETPCLFGIFRPSVYIPQDTPLDTITLKHVIVHEVTHYRHGDHILALFKGLCLAVHWFNPLVWWAAFLSGQDSELACDEGVVRVLGESEREAYGQTLINMTAISRTRIMLTATTMTGTRKTIYERICMIAHHPARSAVLTVVLILAAALAASCTFPGASSILGGNGLKIVVDYSNVGDSFEIARDLRLFRDEACSDEVAPKKMSKEDNIFTYIFDEAEMADEYWLLPAMIYQPAYSDSSIRGEGKAKAGTYISIPEASDQNWLRVSEVEVFGEYGRSVRVRISAGIGLEGLPVDLVLVEPDSTSLDADSSMIGYDPDLDAPYKEYEFTLSEKTTDEGLADYSLKVIGVMMPALYHAEYQCESARLNLVSGIIPKDNPGKEHFEDILNKDYSVEKGQLVSTTELPEDNSERVIQGLGNAQIVYSITDIVQNLKISSGTTPGNAWVIVPTAILEEDCVQMLINCVELAKDGSPESMKSLFDRYSFTADYISKSDMGFEALLVTFHYSDWMEQLESLRAEAASEEESLMNEMLAQEIQFMEEEAAREAAEEESEYKAFKESLETEPENSEE